MRRSVIALVAGIAAAAVGYGTLLPTAAASVTTTTAVKETCNALVGNDIKVQFTGCTGSKTDGTSAVGTAKGSTRLKITFNSGRTAIESYKYKTQLPTGCQSVFGFVRHAKYVESGSILSGATANDLIGSKVSATLCVYVAQIGDRILIQSLRGTVVHL